MKTINILHFSSLRFIINTTGKVAERERHDILPLGVALQIFQMSLFLYREIIFNNQSEI